MITLKESVNPEGLTWIINNMDSFVIKEELKKFKRYVDRIENNHLFVKYNFAKCGRGRLYADSALSLQSFSKKIRNILAKDIYHDIDMVNAHPTILYQLCQRNKLETPELREYIEYRDCVLKHSSKRTILSIIYGNVKFLKSPYLQRLADEMSKVCKHLANGSFSELSLILQTIENEILLKIVEFYGKERVGVLSFDGLLLYKDGKPLQLEECEAYVTDWKIKLIEKSI
jgi:hypothetical protein